MAKSQVLRYCLLFLLATCKWILSLEVGWSKSFVNTGSIGRCPKIILIRDDEEMRPGCALLQLLFLNDNDVYN